MTVQDALRDAARRLESVSATPRLDAELLMAHALGVAREVLLLAHTRAEAPAGFGPLLERRLAHEPVAYILGRRAFWTIELEVGPGVLVPRPDSETLIAAAIDHFGTGRPATILDLGTGPGTLLLAALDQWPDARGLGIDRSETALAYARRNAERLGLADRADLHLGDWGEGIDGPFDLILCNPPYIESAAPLPAGVADWEPPEALYAGPDGLDDYRRLAPEIARLLAPGGVACVEIGAGQEAAVTAIFGYRRFTVSSLGDLNGVIRCLILVANRE
ncbi:peptide chain release factor N(5)-glutamine methyltransferase [Sphingosinicella sp. LHD-64]|uniref:peptide chain release factor N(5)-glutamine methyltransferase n=1 Tax=Sphingosinicella sp. LHD-64 TaxID=3072139 RepID=UPI00280C779B|nr:peptide chain release factor N(5)-glutamine methyltransferase [Sphingosinicella sp. LHD-64]MDQ8756698.1 peptide chain release factor N(5)-glutamine methyltransferase [Sphingosinicella sp. LHD-64]